MKQKLLAITPSHICDASIAIAAGRAGGLGILDLGYTVSSESRASALKTISSEVKSSLDWGVRWDTLGVPDRSPSVLKQLINPPISVLLLAGAGADSLKLLRREAGELASTVLMEVTMPEEAEAAQAAGFDGVVVKGNEAAGRVSQAAAFSLAQRFHRLGLKIPFWIQGGMGPQIAGGGCPGRRRWCCPEGTVLADPGGPVFRIRKADLGKSRRIREPVSWHGRLDLEVPQRLLEFRAQRSEP